MPPEGNIPAPRRTQRLLLLGFGYLCLVLAAIGAVLPVMPTTVFLLGAVWAFGKASPRLQAKLLAHPRFGEGLRTWREQGAIRPRAKRAALLAMGAGFAVLFVTTRDWRILGGVGACLAAVALFIVTRPSGEAP